MPVLSAMRIIQIERITALIGNRSLLAGRSYASNASAA
jgi:hypothetical protein